MCICLKWPYDIVKTEPGEASEQQIAVDLLHQLVLKVSGAPSADKRIGRSGASDEPQLIS